MQPSITLRLSGALIAVVIAAGCATTSTTAAPNSTPEVLVDQSGRVYRTTDAAATVSFSVSADSTFNALVEAFRALGIEPSTIDPAGRVVSRQGLMLRGRFQGDRLSTAFDCGTGQLGPRADDGRIRADITSRVASAGSGSTVTTAIQASLTPNDGAAHDPIRCASNGGFEEKLRRETSLRLGIPYQRSR